MRSVLVTGGAGFIGSHLVDRLIGEGNRVLVVDNLSKGKIVNVNQQANFEKLDITSSKLKKLIESFKPEIIFHFAAQSSINESFKTPQKVIKVNFLATQILLETSQKSKIKKIVFASSAAVYKPIKKQPILENDPKEPIAIYGVTKLCSEYLLANYWRLHKLPYVSLRFANVYGKRQDNSAEGGVVAIFIKRIIKNKPVLIFGNGQQTRDFIYVSDVVDACLLSLEDKVNGEFNIGTAQETSILNLYNKLLKLSGRQGNNIFAKRRFLEAKRSSLSFKKFKNTCGWQPKLNLDRGLELTFDYFQKNQ